MIVLQASRRCLTRQNLVRIHFFVQGVTMMAMMSFLLSFVW